MAQAKRKTATKTAKKTTAKKTQCRKQACTRTTKNKGISQQEKMHVYLVTGLAIIAGILLCADAAMMIV
ncbi:hypothetical protein IKF30_02100 [Candidatus Saccharibacteria bacterium]|nr:hypothetical protein [Candidatus Saccharibacteria bacterium]